MRALVSDKSVRAELRRCLETLSFVWSLAAFVSGWATLRAQYCAFPAYLAYVLKECKTTDDMTGIAAKL